MFEDTKDGEKNVVTHKYDSFGRKEWTEQYLGNGEKIKTSFEYYPNNLTRKIIDDKGNTTEYKYDDQKRVTKVIYPDLSTLEYTYTEKTEAGKKYNMVIEKQRNGTLVTTIYDEMNRVKSRSIEPGPGVEGVTLESYGYDGLSRLTHAANDYSTVDLKYDPLNRVTEETQNGKIIAYTYGVENNLRKMTMKYPNQRIIERDFDILDRVSKLRQGQENIADYKYIGRSYRVLSQQFGNGDAVSYLYDQGRRMTSKEAKNKNSDLINKYNYGYNNVQMKKYEQRGHDSNKGDVFAYDEIYRLSGVKFNSPEPTNPTTDQYEKKKALTFDDLSNILRIAETMNGQDKLITTEIPADSNYSKLNQYERFDQWGLSYDLNGNLTQRGTQKMYHDYRNRMVRVIEGTTTTENKYDALGRRMQKIVTTGSQSKTENYYYAGQQVIEERDGDDQVIRQYIYGNGIDEIIRVDKYTGTASTPYYFHRNAIGSTTAVTDADGNVVERVEYDLYGMPTFKDTAGNEIPKSSIGNNFLFHGREYDPELNLYYYRARYYDPIMGRFLQTDTKGYKSSMNLYEAFNNNPVNFIDPLGFDWAEYTGRVITWYGGKPYDRSTPIDHFPATSGYRYYQNSGYTWLKGKGPIPEGLYRINLSPNPNRWASVNRSTGDVYWDSKGGIQKIPWGVRGENGVIWDQPGWGNIRAYLEPDSRNEMSGRFPDDRFYVHNSNKGYTHGCVETSNGFFNRLLIYRLKHPKETYFKFNVQYSGESTLGDTLNAVYPPLIVTEEVTVTAE